MTSRDVDIDQFLLSEMKEKIEKRRKKFDKEVRIVNLAYKIFWLSFCFAMFTLMFFFISFNINACYVFILLAFLGLISYGVLSKLAPFVEEFEKDELIYNEELIKFKLINTENIIINIAKKKVSVLQIINELGEKSRAGDLIDDKLITTKELTLFLEKLVFDGKIIPLYINGREIYGLPPSRSRKVRKNTSKN